MIIVEGADNVGKSTLVKQLLELDPGLRLLHRDRYKPSQQETIATSYLRALVPADGDRLRHSYGVIDRFFASECIYGDLFRNGCRMSAAEHLAVRLMLVAYRPLIIWCDTDDAIITESWSKREQLYNRDPLLIARAYRERIRDIFNGFPVIKYDWTDATAAQQRDYLVHAVHRTRWLRTQASLSWWSAIPNGIGQLHHARVILVGAAFEPDTLLDDALTSALGDIAGTVPIWDYCYVTNATKGTHNDAALLREELRFVRSPRGGVVITLGHEAEELLAAVVPQIGSFNYNIVNFPRPSLANRQHYFIRLRALLSHRVPGVLA